MLLIGLGHRDGQKMATLALQTVANLFNLANLHKRNQVRKSNA